MPMQSLREFERIRSELLPAAGELRAMVDGVPRTGHLSGQTQTDLSMLGVYAQQFQTAAGLLQVVPYHANRLSLSVAVGF